MIAYQSPLTVKEAVVLSELASGTVNEQATDMTHYVCKGSVDLHRFGVNRVKAIGMGTFREAAALEWCNKLRTGTWLFSVETIDGYRGSYQVLRAAQPAVTALASARELVEILSK